MALSFPSSLLRSRFVFSGRLAIVDPVFGLARFSASFQPPLASVFFDVTFVWLFGIVQLETLYRPAVTAVVPHWPNPISPDNLVS